MPTSLRNESIYGLWGQYYDTTNGWHRGIDVVPGGTVHAILDGVFCHSGTYYICVYNSDLEITVTYMHLNEETFTIGDEISQGDSIGTQGAKSTGSAHTHVEINDGRVESNIHIRPWTSYSFEESMAQTPISELQVGMNFPRNPYPTIEHAWGLLPDES